MMKKYPSSATKRLHRLAKIAFSVGKVLLQRNTKSWHVRTEDPVLNW